MPALVMAVGRMFGTGGAALVSRLLGAAENGRSQESRAAYDRAIELAATPPRPPT